MNTELENRLAEADLYAGQGLANEATAIYKDLLKVLGDDGDPLRKMVEQRLGNLEQNDDSQASSSQAHIQDTYTEWLRRFNTGRGLIEAGFHLEAVEEFKRLLEERHRVGEINAKIGEAYLHLDMPFEAIEHLDDALRDHGLPQKIRLDVLYKLALTHERNGVVALAIDALEQIVRVDPSFRNATERFEALSQSAQKFGRFYYFIRNGRFSEDQYEHAVKLARQGKKPLESILIDQFGIEKSEVGASLREYYRCPFVEFNELEVGSIPACIHGIKEHFFRTNSCVPLREQGGNLLVAMDDPHDIVKIDNIHRVLKAANFQFAVALKEDIDKFIDYFYGKYSLGGLQEDVFEQLEIVQEDEAEEEDTLATDSDSVVVQMANKIIEDAYVRRASDIHVESLTGKRGALIRFRIDGDCLQYQTIPYNYKRALISRIKILSNLDIAEKRLPQDGKIKFKTRGGRTIELRVATLPTTENNEDIVLRILAASDALPLHRIGLLPNNLERFKGLLEMPYGLVLCVGPTGSGKTTTLHAALGHINRPEKKIWTAEDPVEIVQEGLRQVQVRANIGLTFARVLRAFLRADPDVVMVGETRDEETATTVIEASLTGHLVFSTLHTNTAPETVTRLLGMGMDPFNFADALLGVLSQRLVKRLCLNCRESYRPDTQEQELLLQEYGPHPSVPLDPELVYSNNIYRAKGCVKCNRTGYKGRLAIHELLVSDDDLRQLIQKKATVSEIRHHAVQGGMLTLKQDGIHKILQGETDLKQVRAACVR